MSLSSTLTNLNNARGALVEAINSKGVTVDSSATLYSCVSAIAAIPTGSGGGIDVSSTTAESGDVLSPKIFYDSAGNLTTGTIQTVSATSSGSQITVPSGYIGIPQTFNVSAGAEVTLGYVDSAGNFQPLSFSGTIAEDNGSAVTVSAFYGWNLPVSVSGGGSSGTSSGGGSSGTSSGGSYTSSGGTIFTPVNVSSGQIFESMTVISGGTLTVLSGGIANNTILLGSAAIGGVMKVSSGGTMNNTVIYDGEIICNTAGLVSGTTTYGGWFYIYSCTANNTVINGGNMELNNGGTAENAIVNSHGHLYVRSGGTAKNITVSSGGSFVWNDGAITDNITSMAGAVIEHT